MRKTKTKSELREPRFKMAAEGSKGFRCTAAEKLLIDQVAKNQKR